MNRSGAALDHGGMGTDPSSVRRRLLIWIVALGAPPACGPLTAFAAAGADAWALDPEAARAAALLRSIDGAHWVQEGRGPRVAYVFFDPNCPYSHKLYLATRGAVDKDGLTLRWIPVGRLRSSSPGKAAAILAAPDPLRAFQRNEDDWNFGDSPGGGIAPLAHPAPRIRRWLRANARLMDQTGGTTFPVMLYRGRDGRAHLIVGLPAGDALAAVLRAVR